MFEFGHRLDKQDLADIWQGVMPKIAMSAKKSISTIEHPLGSKYEFFGQYLNSIPDNIKWMVFKIKQKAATNYFATTPQTETGTGFSFQQTELGADVSSPEQELPYSYNWPYDFFSLVELAKIDAELELDPEAGTGGTLPSSVVYGDIPPVEATMDLENAGSSDMAGQSAGLGLSGGGTTATAVASAVAAAAAAAAGGAGVGADGQSAAAAAAAAAAIAQAQGGQGGNQGH